MTSICTPTSEKNQYQRFILSAYSRNIYIGLYVDTNTEWTSLDEWAAYWWAGFLLCAITQALQINKPDGYKLPRYPKVSA